MVNIFGLTAPNLSQKGERSNQNWQKSDQIVTIININLNESKVVFSFYSVVNINVHVSISCQVEKKLICLCERQNLTQGGKLPGTFRLGKCLGLAKNIRCRQIAAQIVIFIQIAAH